MRRAVQAPSPTARCVHWPGASRTTGQPVDRRARAGRVRLSKDAAHSAQSQNVALVDMARFRCIRAELLVPAAIRARLMTTTCSPQNARSQLWHRRMASLWQPGA
jgi:hypothetical protein